MKRTGLLLFAVCITFASLAQYTVDVYSTGAVGSFTTGYSSSTTRTDNAIVVTNTPPVRRGYAVFSLAAVPTTAVVSSVELHFNVEAYSPGLGFGSATRGYVGDLSTITTPATLFTTMTLPTTGIIYTAPYTNGLGNQFLSSEAPAEAFIDANKGNVVSVVWTIPASRVFTITGETGVATTSGTHAPFMRITYNCPGITSVSASPPASSPCPNVAFSLSGAATGGTTYNWTGPLGFSSTLLNPTVSSGLPSSGNYTFTVTDASGCSASATTFVPVFPPPSTIINPITSAAFCEGDSAVLDAPVVAGSMYQWYDDILPIAGATNSSYVSHNSGEFKVEVTDINGCTAMTAVATPVVKLVNPPVSPGDTVLLCNGDNGTLTVNTNGVTSGLAYQWQKNGVDITGAISNAYTVSSSGVYRCEVSVTSTTCAAFSEEVTVDVNDYPIPAVSFSGTVLSTANVYAVYQWFLNTVAIPGATNYNITPGAGGNYRVRVTDHNGCTAFSSGYSVTTVGIADVSTEAIKLYPNPVSNVLNILSPFPVKVVLCSMEGKFIVEYNNPATIDLSALPSGLYFATLYNEAGERVKLEKITRQ